MSGKSYKYGSISRYVPLNINELPLNVAALACKTLREDGLDDVALYLVALVCEAARRATLGIVIDESWKGGGEGWKFLHDMGELLNVLDRHAAGYVDDDEKAEALRKWKQQRKAV